MKKLAAPPPNTFRLMTYNVKNMFDNIDAVKEKGTGEKPVWEMNQLTKVVAEVAPDIMTNQEVENLGIYNKFAQENLNNAMPNTALIDGNDKRGIDVGVMSRYPILNVVSHKDAQFPLADGTGLTRFSRDLLRVDLKVEGEIISVYNTHSASRREGRPEEVWVGDNQRIAEARQIKAIVAEEMGQFPGRFYVITGDFNDGTEDRSLQELINGPGDKLVDTLAGKPEAERLTWPSAPPKKKKFPPEQFDHILIPESMAHRLVDSQVVDLEHRTQTASDHKPIIAHFRLAGH